MILSFVRYVDLIVEIRLFNECMQLLNMFMDSLIYRICILSPHFFTKLSVLSMVTPFGLTVTVLR